MCGMSCLPVDGCAADSAHRDVDVVSGCREEALRDEAPCGGEGAQGGDPGGPAAGVEAVDGVYPEVRHCGGGADVIGKAVGQRGDSVGQGEAWGRARRGGRGGPPRGRARGGAQQARGRARWWRGAPRRGAGEDCIAYRRGG